MSDTNTNGLTTQDKVAITRWAVALSEVLQRVTPATFLATSLHNYIPAERLVKVDDDTTLALALLRATFSMIRLQNALTDSLGCMGEVLRLLADDAETLALYQKQMSIEASGEELQGVDVNASDAGLM